MRRRLNEKWEEFRDAVGLKDVAPAAIIHMRRAFFAGADSFYSIQMTAYDGSTPEPTDADLSVMSDLDAEIREFASRLKAGTA